MRKLHIKSWRPEIIPISLAVIIGITLSVMPHILWFAHTGDPVYIADNDDLLYLSAASTAYHNHPMYLGDPVLVEGGASVYPWLQFIPGIVLTKLIGLSAIHVNIIWRIWAGLSIALGWYLVTRSYLKNSWLALGVTVILMTDIGMLSATLVSKHFTTVAQIAAGKPGELLQSLPQLMVQWRIISPGLSLAYLLLYIWLLHRSLTKPTRSRIIMAAVAFGLLFYVYFYYWTSVGLALSIGMLLDARNRRIYLLVGIFGFLFGVPQIIGQTILKASSNPEWLQRSDKFVPIPHFSELLLPKLAIGVIIISLFWVMFRRKDLVSLWALAASSLALANHQILTGLQIENFHWVYCWGPVTSLLLIIIILDLASSFQSWKRPLIFGGIALTSLYLTTGLWLRSVEAMQTKESVELTTNYYNYYNQRFNSSTAFLAPRAVVTGSKEFVDFAVILENQRLLAGYSVVLSPAVDNAEWDARIALEDYLQGLNRSEFIAKQVSSLSEGPWGPWARDPKKRSERLESRQKYFDDVVKDPVAAFRRFQVRYVALPANMEPPEYLNSGWRLLQAGPHWQVWEFENQPRT